MQFRALVSTIILLFLSFCEARPQGYDYNYNDNCTAAYRQYMSLRLTEGNAAILREIHENPYNLMAAYLADYDDFLLLAFNGDPKEYRQRKSHMDERLAILGKGSEDSPWYRLCKAGIYLHWAVIHGRFGENFKAAVAFRKSFQLLKENRQQFPAFAPNNVFFGLEEAVVGTIPEDYKWLASVFGLKGNIKNGVARLTGFINTTSPADLFHDEAIIYHCYLKFYLLSHQQEVWNFVNSSQFSAQNSLLFSFIKTNLAINYRKAEAALQTLRSARNMDNYTSFPVMDYEMGNALLLKLDYSCAAYLQRYISHNAGKLYTKDSWQKLAWAWYLQGNQQKAQFCKEQILKSGNELTDADKQARRFAEGSEWPHPLLLQARLLTDGGYYQQALTKLGNATEASFGSIPDKLEFNFRLGRIYDELGNDDRACQYYRAAIAMGKDRPEHFAARSALQMGMIYERRGRIQDAVTCYRICLGMRNHDFQSSLDQQAKAGINRLSGGS